MKTLGNTILLVALTSINAIRGVVSAPSQVQHDTAALSGVEVQGRDELVPISANIRTIMRLLPTCVLDAAGCDEAIQGKLGLEAPLEASDLHHEERAVLGEYGPPSYVIHKNGSDDVAKNKTLRILLQRSFVSYGIEMSFHLPYLFAKPAPCSVWLRLEGASDGINWATSLDPLGGPMFGNPTPKLRVSHLDGTIDPACDGIDRWVNATRGEPFNTSIEGYTDPIDKTWKATVAKGMCSGGENNLLIEPDVDGMIVYWWEPTREARDGFRIEFPDFQ